jgi:hypothetical protein
MIAIKQANSGEFQQKRIYLHEKRIGIEKKILFLPSKIKQLNKI